VAVIDDQPTPGGQVWRNAEAASEAQRALLGPQYAAGRALIARFRASGADYRSATEAWRIEPGWRVHCRSDAGVATLQAEHLVLACGAQERPVPFPGWTLPGVLTVGAAQTLLKQTGDIPTGAVWIAGSGPLCLLYMKQLLAAGGRINGFLNTAPVVTLPDVAPHLLSALRGWRDLMRGAGWIAELRRAGIRSVRVRAVEAVGGDRLQAVRYETADGRRVEEPASVLLVHEGIIPALHAPMSLGCEIRWNERQACFAPRTDACGATSVDRLYLAGDVAGIEGADAAVLSGAICGQAIAARLNRSPPDAIASSTLQAARAGRRAVRPLLDTLYRPRHATLAPADSVIVCRCEEVTADRIRAAVVSSGSGAHNAVKAHTRAGMGPCQGRQCALTVAALIAAATAQPMSEIGLPNVRDPLKPITLGEIASEVIT
jgi:NADPH-dependent 2,4-dienoyl-CoA reductase/sulfur reductase-like enzyme